METQLITSWAETNGSSVLSSQWELALFWQTDLIDFRLFLMGVQNRDRVLLVLDWDKASIPLFSLETLVKNYAKYCNSIQELT